jgi:hypothetical protein
MHPDIEKTISMIDRQISDLQRAKKTLIEVFGEKETQNADKITQSLPFPKSTKITRKEAVIKFLQEQGPLSRGEIVKKSGIPVGTVSFILNDKTRFTNKDGKWHVIESEKEKGETEENAKK